MRYRNEGDVERGNGWTTRSKGIFDLINYERWEIFGAQELLHDQMLDLVRNLDNYDYIGVAREDGAEDGEYAPIFFRSIARHFPIRPHPTMRTGVPANTKSICSAATRRAHSAVMAAFLQRYHSFFSRSNFR